MAGKDKSAKDSLEFILSQKVRNPQDFEFLDELSLTRAQMLDLTNDDVLMGQLVFKAMRGDTKAIQEVLDRRYGKAPQHIVQETHTYTYTNFLDKIEEDEAQGLQLDTGVTIDLPQIEEQKSTEGGGPSDDTLLDDLGLSSTNIDDIIILEDE